uniref:C-type lectin domain-containing protein n=1 Tax=Salarias fasciatus TaxID=181472 RepID=A0A672FFI4_SALFA
MQIYCDLFFLICPGACCLTTCREYGFVVVDEAKSWTEAQKYCREQHIDLASVATMEDTENLKSLTARNPNEKYWIGLYFVETPWKWTLQSHVGEHDTFRNWHMNPTMDPGRNTCAYMLPTGQWVEEDCRNKHHILCMNGEKKN